MEQDKDKQIETPIDSSVREVIDEMKKRKQARDRGDVFCIPFFDDFPKFGKYCPGIIKGILYKITAGSGIGKTQFTKQMFCITPLEWMRKNPGKIKIKIFYFALEESESEFIHTLISNRLASKHGIRIDPVELKMYRENYPDDEKIKLIEDCEADVQYYMNHIEVVDSEYNPTGLYKYCRSYSERTGTHHWENKIFTKKKKDGSVEETDEKVYVRYEPHDPDLHVIVITDHMSLITGEYDKKSDKILTKHQAMAKWSTEYCKKQITKHWGWTVVNVQQQEQGSEKQQFTITGRSIQEKTEPTLDALANNKEVQRDDYVAIGIYSPDRFGFSEYHGYDIDSFRDTFRSIRFLKNRIGVPYKYVHFLFDGATNRFVELPNPEEDDEKLARAYRTADKLLGRPK